MSFRIPCGGFELDESSFSLENKKLSTAPVSWDSLKDKPFGEEGSLSDLEVLLPLAEHPMKYMGSGYGDYGEGVELVVGETYTVLFNGVEYVCVAQYVPDSVQYIYLGAPSSYEDNGCPFSFVVTPTNWTCSLTLSYEGAGVETFTLAVYKGAVRIKTIDPKYLPGGHVVIPITLNNDETITVNADAATVEKACSGYENGGSAMISYDAGGMLVRCGAIASTNMGGAPVLLFNLVVEGRVVGTAVIGVMDGTVVAEVQTNS